MKNKIKALKKYNFNAFYIFIISFITYKIYPETIPKTAEEAIIIMG